MKANRRHEIVAETSRTKTEHGDEFVEASWSSRVIGVARVRAMDVRAKRAKRSGRVLCERELIQANVVRIRSDTLNGFLLGTHQWAALL